MWSLFTWINYPPPVVESVICVNSNWKLKVVEVFLATSGCLVELPPQFLHRKSADRAAWTPRVPRMEAEARPWARRGAQRRPPWDSIICACPCPCEPPGMRRPIPGTGGRCRPVITDDIHEVVFQIGFPVLPAASGASSTGRITQVAGQAQGMWP